MCVIVTSETGTMPGLAQLAQMSQTNPDGTGIAWHDGRRLRRHRNADNTRTLGFIIANYRYFTRVPFLLHFRLATNGKVCEANTHPFAFRHGRQSGFMAHNGIARDYVRGPHECDSRNAIEAWQQDDATLDDGRQGKFALIDQSGRIQWLYGAQPVQGAHGTITVSNLNWQDTGDQSAYGCYQSGQEEAFDAGWQEGYDAALARPDTGRDDEQADDELDYTPHRH
jgi:predicted glutamine amidotransferase